jgi:hypothetical protein
MWAGASLEPLEWSRICTLIKSGGLGAKNLIQFNRSLLEEWLWRNALEREALWRLIIETKYDSLRAGCCSKKVTMPFGVRVHKYIGRGWETFSTFVRYKMGGGSKASFWHNAWCEDQPLKISF